MKCVVVRMVTWVIQVLFELFVKIATLTVFMYVTLSKIVHNRRTITIQTNLVVTRL